MRPLKSAHLPVLAAARYLADTDVIRWLTRKDIADKERRIRELEQQLATQDKIILQLGQLLAYAETASEQATKAAAHANEQLEKIKTRQPLLIATNVAIAECSAAAIHKIPEHLLVSHPKVQALKREIGKLKRAAADAKQVKDREVVALAGE